MTNYSNAIFEECEKEPLPFIGNLQPQGGMLFLSKKTKKFEFVSENIDSFLDQSPKEILGLDGTIWLQDNLPDLVELPKIAGNRVYLPNSLDLGKDEMDVILSPTSEGWIIDLEFSQTNYLAPNESYSFSLDTKSFQEELVKNICHATNYNRIMLYKFKPDWSGEVIAEEVQGTDGSYMSLNFPASDIPAIARGIYALTPYRYIPTVEDPKPIFGLNSKGEKIDLTWSEHRAVSPVHIQYLKNMNVRGSFSISIVVDGKLWGLVACHKDSEGFIPLKTRLLCKEWVNLYSKHLEKNKENNKKVIQSKINQFISDIQIDLENNKNLTNTLLQQLPEFSKLVESNSGAVVVGQDVHSWNLNENTELINQIHNWAIKQQSTDIFISDYLPDTLRNNDYHIRGLLSYGIRSKSMNNALISFYFFRPEEVEEIAWAGNPQKPIENVEGNAKLSPRNSFEKWVQKRNGYSRAWTEENILVSEILRESLYTNL
jgi:two-component system, chemotaxis family, sensor kinase Cph1